MASDTLFFSLPRALQRRIYSAFDSVARPTKVSSAGGFFPESDGFLQDDQGDLSGGFIQGDSGGFIRNTYEERTPTRIPLSMIPSALQILDLPPDDEEVLAVFRNAATGWTSSDNVVDAHSIETEEYVSRSDWCSVCAVLLEHNTGEDVNTNDDIEMTKESDGASDTDEYHESEHEENDNDDDSDYMEGPSASATRRRTRQTRKLSSSLSPPRISTSPDSKSYKLTPRQRQVCIDTYTLFFPSSPADKLLDQRIMIKDIQRVAKLLNEKLKTEEMLEMLETFSTSPDKSMNFDDFCHMMISAKLA